MSPTPAPDDPTALRGWTPPPPPPRTAMAGRLARLVPLTPAHAPALHAAFASDAAGWDYLPYGPFPDAAGYAAWIERDALGDDPLFFAIEAGGAPLGVASYLSVVPAHGVIEIGHLRFAPALRRTPAATEALWLMMAAAFDAGYRRVEWKCNARNAASRRAAQRLGLSFEGVFRNHRVFKGRNRDSAWFAATDAEAPALRTAFARWLDPANFDPQGRQREPLSALTRPLLAATDPTQR